MENVRIWRKLSIPSWWCDGVTLMGLFYMITMCRSTRISSSDLDLDFLSNIDTKILPALLLPLSSRDSDSPRWPAAIKCWFCSALITLWLEIIVAVFESARSFPRFPLASCCCWCFLLADELIFFLKPNEIDVPGRGVEKILWFLVQWWGGGEKWNRKLLWDYRIMLDV